MSIYISPMKKVPKFFVQRIVETRMHMSQKSRTLLLYACISIYGRYKENLQQESFCKSIAHRSVNHLALALRLFAAPPFHFIKSKDRRGRLKSSVSQAMPSSTSFYVFNLSLNIQSLSLYMYSSLLFFFTLILGKKKSSLFIPLPLLCSQTAM